MYIFIALGWNLKLNPNYRVTTAANTKAEVLSPGDEHTLVPTRRDHAFFDVGGPLGCLVVSGVGGPQFAWRHSLVFGDYFHTNDKSAKYRLRARRLSGNLSVRSII